MKIAKYFKSNLYNISKMQFNVPSQPGANTPAQPAEKTPLQIKIDNYIDRWPDFVKNADIETSPELYNLKIRIEHTYKAYYQGDKNVINEWQIPRVINETTYPAQAILGTTVTGLADVLEKFEGFLETKFIFDNFDKITELKDSVSKDMFTVIIPILKHYMVKFDRHCIIELFHAARGGARMMLGDREFWNIVEGKLIGEKLYKYLSVEQTVNLAYELNKSERGSEALLKALEIEIIKHRAAIHLDKRLLKKAKETYLEKGSDIMKAALADPNIEVPGVDIKIPEMNLRPNHQKQCYERRNLH